MAAAGSRQRQQQVVAAAAAGSNRQQVVEAGSRNSSSRQRRQQQQVVAAGSSNSSSSGKQQAAAGSSSSSSSVNVQKWDLSVARTEEDVSTTAVMLRRGRIIPLRSELIELLMHSARQEASPQTVKLHVRIWQVLGEEVATHSEFWVMRPQK